MQEDFDVIIAGGSMVGAALACALADGGLRVAVIEPGALPELDSLPEEYDLRVSAITRASQRIFEHLGAWESMLAQRVNPYREMHVWDAGGAGVIHFDSADIGEDNLGYIVENRVIQAALLRRLQEWPNAVVFGSVGLASYAAGEQAVEVLLDDGRSLRAALLVGADGAHSVVRTQADIAIQGWDYGQKAVVATVQTEYDNQETAWQRFLPTGPLAFLPLDRRHCSVVWSTTHEQAEQLLALPQTEFCAHLGQAFEHQLGNVVHTGPRAAFPLRLQHAKTYVRSRVALVGDAAHTVHPLAGQGVNLGLLDAAALAEVVLQGRQSGRDIGDYLLLRRYERWRKGDNLAMMAVMDGFKRLFGNPLGPVRWARNAGLSAVNATPVIKKTIIRSAMGLTGDLPKLACPTIS